jgi:sugar/nucleoside kinase (ribokinase family)
MNHYFSIKIEFVVSTDIREAVEEALELSEKTGNSVEFDFNGKLMNVRRINQLSLEEQIKYYIDIYYSYVNSLEKVF